MRSQSSRPPSGRGLKTHHAGGALLLCVATLLWIQPAQAEKAYYLSAYWAKNSPEKFADVLTGYNPEMRSSYLNAITLGYAFSEGVRTRVEVEGSVAKHHGMQDHWEANVAIIARWMHFPWDEWVDTRLAIGEGLSYATETPPLEPRKDPDEEESTRLLNLLIVEIELAPPGDSPWSTFGRIHHRSGVGGLFGDVRGGSNFLGIGVRYRLGW